MLWDGGQPGLEPKFEERGCVGKHAVGARYNGRREGTSGTYDCLLCTIKGVGRSEGSGDSSQPDSNI